MEDTQPKDRTPHEIRSVTVFEALKALEVCRGSLLETREKLLSLSVPVLEITAQISALDRTVDSLSHSLLEVFSIDELRAYLACDAVYNDGRTAIRQLTELYLGITPLNVVPDNRKMVLMKILNHHDGSVADAYASIGWNLQSSRCEEIVEFLTTSSTSDEGSD